MRLIVKLENNWKRTILKLTVRLIVKLKNNWKRTILKIIWKGYGWFADVFYYFFCFHGIQFYEQWVIKFFWSKIRKRKRWGNIPNRSFIFPTTHKSSCFSNHFLTLRSDQIGANRFLPCYGWVGFLHEWFIVTRTFVFEQVWFKIWTAE